MIPDILIVGHLAWDLTEWGAALGGTAAYASIAALRLGSRPALLTSTGPDLDASSALPGVRVHCVPSARSTVFRNRYRAGVRTQTVGSVAGALTVRDVPAEFRAAPLVLLGPLMGEVGSGLVGAFPGATVAACLQGWLRRRDGEGLVRPAAWDGGDVLPFVDAAIVSKEDAADVGDVERWAPQAGALVVTEGAAGARAHVGGVWHRVEPFRAREVDPTGAGDVFSAAYLIRYGETSDPLESARFAACAASLSVEGVGTAAIPTRARVEARMSGGPEARPAGGGQS